MTGDIDALLDGPLAGIVAAVHAGDADPVEIARRAADRAGRGPDAAFVTVDGSVAEAAARDLARRLAGGQRPALAGVPVAHKDLLDTAEFPTSYGNPALGRQPDASATAVARTVAAGALQVGKTNLHESAYGVTGVNPFFGTPANPRAPGRVPGGSSSGSAAAVAARVVCASLGTDSGGSVRIPAACCGVVGIKSTRGAVPTTGVLPLSWLHDTVGPLAARAADAAAVLAVVAGADGHDPVAVDPPDGWAAALGGASRPGPLGWVDAVLPTEMWQRIDPDVATACRGGVAALEEAGATAREVDLSRFRDVRRAHATLLGAHALAVHGDRLARDPAVFGEAVRHRLEANQAITAPQVAHALHVRDGWLADLAGLFGVPPAGRPPSVRGGGGADGGRGGHGGASRGGSGRSGDGRATVVVTPTLPMPVPEVGQDHVDWPDGRREDVTPALTRLTGVWNVAGIPAVSVPCGASADGLPVGLQIAGAWWSEPDLVAVAAVVESGAPPG